MALPVRDNYRRLARSVHRVSILAVSMCAAAVVVAAATLAAGASPTTTAEIYPVAVRGADGEKAALHPPFLPLTLDAERQADADQRPKEDPIMTIPATTYPVCNGPGPRPGPYGPTLRAWQASLYANCTVAQPDLLRRCALTSFRCCDDAVPSAGGASGAGIQCDLSSGLCHVMLLSPPGRMLIGSWRAVECAKLLVSDGSPTCACRTERVGAGAWSFPAPCVLLLPSSGLVDAAGVATVSTTSFGPYRFRNTTTPRPTAVNVPGEEPLECAPAETARVATCDADTAARAAVVFDKCLVRRGFRISLGRPGDCCATLVKGSSSVIHCILGGDCVRVSAGSTRVAVVANDWAPAAGGGCHGPGGIRIPPGQAPGLMCQCVPPDGAPAIPVGGGGAWLVRRRRPWQTGAQWWTRRWGGLWALGIPPLSPHWLSAPRKLGALAVRRRIWPVAVEQCLH